MVQLDVRNGRIQWPTTDHVSDHWGEWMEICKSRLCVRGEGYNFCSGCREHTVGSRACLPVIRPWGSLASGFLPDSIVIKVLWYLKTLQIGSLMFATQKRTAEENFIFIVQNKEKAFILLKLLRFEGGLCHREIIKMMKDRYKLHTDRTEMSKICCMRSLQRTTGHSGRFLCWGYVPSPIHGGQSWSPQCKILCVITGFFIRDSMYQWIPLSGDFSFKEKLCPIHICVLHDMKNKCSSYGWWISLLFNLSLI